MKIFLINLDRSTDRLAHMRAVIDGPFERIAAVDGRNVPARFAGQFKNSDGLTDGEVGCYASHLLAAERIVGEGLTHALILEDDVRFLIPDWRAIAKAALEAAPDKWDVIIFGANKRQKTIQIAPLGAGFDLVRFNRLPMGTSAYLLSYNGAAKILKPAERHRPIDVELRYHWERHLNVMGVHPPLAEQMRDVFPSTIAIRGHKSKQHRPSIRSLITGKYVTWRQNRCGVNR